MHRNNNPFQNNTTEDGGSSGGNDKLLQPHNYNAVESAPSHFHSQTQFWPREDNSQQNKMNSFDSFSRPYYPAYPSAYGGNLTYRVPPLQVTQETARTVSRPELVVRGLKDMCNLVKASEPAESPNAKSRSHFRFGHSSSPKLASPPIPPPTAFDAGLIATEKIFSSLNEEIDNENDFHNYKSIISPRSVQNLTQAQSQAHNPLVPEDEAKICRVLHNMMTKMGGYDKDDGDEGPCSGRRGAGESGGSARIVISSARLQLNAVSVHRSSMNVNGAEPNTEYLKYENYSPECPPVLHEQQQHILDFNNNIDFCIQQPKQRVWSTLTQTILRDKSPQPASPRVIMEQSKENSISCQTDLDKLEKGESYSSPRQAQCSIVEDKCTSTSDVDKKLIEPEIPSSASQIQQPVLQNQFFYQQSQPHKSFVHETQLVDHHQSHQIQQQQQSLQQHVPNKSVNVSGYSDIVPGGEFGGSQQHSPIYILQTLPNQQMPIFFVQSSPPPENNGTVSGQTPQNAIFLQQVQCQQISYNPHISQAEGQQLITPQKIQPVSQVTTVKATRVETRTTVQNSCTANPHEQYSKYEYIKQLVSGPQKQAVSLAKSSLRKKQGHTQLHIQRRSRTKPQPQPPKDVNGKEEITFIVGPSPVESMHEMEVLQNHGSYAPQREMKNHPKPGIRVTPKFSGKLRQATTTLSQPRTTRKGESFSDTMLNRDKIQLKNMQQKQFYRRPTIQEIVQIDEANYESEDEHEDLCCGERVEPELATPTTSSHTITIKTNVRRGENHDRPCISSCEDDHLDQRMHDEEEGHAGLEEPSPAYHNMSTSSIMEAEPVRIIRPQYTNNKLRVGKKKLVKPPSHPPKKEQHAEVSDLEIHGLYPTTENVDIWPEPGFMRDRKSVSDQQKDNDSVAEKSVAEGIALIEDGSSWERNVCGLRVISVQVHFQEIAVLERLPSLVSSIQKHIRASGSKLARQAILTLRDLFTTLGPHFDPFLHSLSERLFSKMANTNKFIKDDCEATLESMVEHCSQPKMITILENVARRHKHSAIRLVACKMITKFVGFVGPNSALEDYAHLILPLLCCNLAERTGEIREEARNSLRLLVPNPDFDAFMRHNVSPQFIFAICEKLERIRDEVSDRPRIRRKISRNHSLFKWQQKYSHTNMM